MDNDLIDMIAAGEKGSASDVHSKIKDLLYSKAAENIDLVKPAVTADMFGGPNPYLQDEEEVENEPEATEADGTPSSVEDTAEVEAPTAEVDAPDDEEVEKPEA